MSDFQQDNPIKTEVKEEEEVPTMLISQRKKVKLEDQIQICQVLPTKDVLFASLKQFLTSFGITDIKQFVEESMDKFQNTQDQVITQKDVVKKKIYDKGKKVLARLSKHQTDKFYEPNMQFHQLFNNIQNEFSKHVVIGQQEEQEHLYNKFLEFQNKIRIKTKEQDNIVHNYIVNFIMLLCKFYIYSINKTLFEHYYQDLLILFQQIKLAKPINLCLKYLKGEKSFEQLLTEMNEKDWRDLQATVKKYYEIGRFYYKSHCCDYYNYIVENNWRQNCYKEWFDLKSQTEQCSAGKKQFINMRNNIINSNNKELQQHMQNFTSFEHYKQLMKRQNKQDFQLSQYLDDIYNCMIQYPFVAKQMLT